MNRRLPALTPLFVRWVLYRIDLEGVRKVRRRSCWPRTRTSAVISVFIGESFLSKVCCEFQCFNARHPMAMLCEHEGVFWMQVELPTNVEIERKWASLRVNEVGPAHRVLVKNAAAILFTRQIHSMQPSRQFAKHLRQGQLFKGKKWIVPESLMEISSR